MTTGEIWRSVPSVPELLVSSDGRIMTAPWIGEMPHGGPKHYGGKPYFGVWNKQDGRFVISHRSKNYKIARLVCEAFNGPPPFKDAVCMHLDENAANNRATNLKWGTQKENLQAEGFKAYCRSRVGENSPTVKARSKKKRKAA